MHNFYAYRTTQQRNWQPLCSAPRSILSHDPPAQVCLPSDRPDRRSDKKRPARGGAKTAVSLVAYSMLVLHALFLLVGSEAAKTKHTTDKGKKFPDVNREGWELTRPDSDDRP